MNIPSVSLKEAIRLLRGGGVVVFPTETSYGLAADAQNAAAVKKIFAIKGRAPAKTVPLIVSTTAMAKTWAVFPTEASHLVRTRWPGPLTLVLAKQKGSKLAPSVIAPDGTIAVRVSAHPVARALAKALKGPIVSTSANQSGEPACYSPRAVQKAFKGAKIQPDALIDSGRLPKRKPSTIIAFSEGKPVVLRK